jgi:hypothetical protein
MTEVTMLTPKTEDRKSTDKLRMSSVFRTNPDRNAPGKMPGAVKMLMEPSVM